MNTKIIKQYGLGLGLESVVEYEYHGQTEKVPAHFDTWPDDVDWVSVKARVQLPVKDPNLVHGIYVLGEKTYVSWGFIDKDSKIGVKSNIYRAPTIKEALKKALDDVETGINGLRAAIEKRGDRLELRRARLEEAEKEIV